MVGPLTLFVFSLTYRTLKRSLRIGRKQKSKLNYSNIGGRSVRVSALGHVSMNANARSQCQVSLGHSPPYFKAACLTERGAPPASASQHWSGGHVPSCLASAWVWRSSRPHAYTGHFLSILTGPSPKPLIKGLFLTKNYVSWQGGAA